jgi:hypothetical protein
MSELEQRKQAENNVQKWYDNSYFAGVMLVKFTAETETERPFYSRAIHSRVEIEDIVYQAYQTEDWYVLPLFTKSPDCE